MRDRKVALRYAQALFAVARERGVVDALDESLQGLSAVVAEHAGFRLFLQNPQVTLARKKELVQTAFGGKVEPVMMHFLELLLDKDRILYLRDIQAAFRTLVEDHKGLQRALVVTAVPLTDDLQERLVRKLAAMTGRQIILEKKVDPSVIGGVCVTMGDQILDGTVRTGLQRLRDVLDTAPLSTS